jgi:hypothetical protein
LKISKNIKETQMYRGQYCLWFPVLLYQECCCIFIFKDVQDKDNYYNLNVMLHDKLVSTNIISCDYLGDVVLPYLYSADLCSADLCL